MDRRRYLVTAVHTYTSRPFSRIVTADSVEAAKVEAQAIAWRDYIEQSGSSAPDATADEVEEDLLTIAAVITAPNMDELEVIL